MFLTHFLPVMDYTPSREKLVEFMKRGAGVWCKTGQEGIDLIIPVLLAPLSAEQGGAMDVDSGDLHGEQWLGDVQATSKRAPASTVERTTTKAPKRESDGKWLEALDGATGLQQSLVVGEPR